MPKKVIFPQLHRSAKTHNFYSKRTQPFIFNVDTLRGFKYPVIPIQLDRFDAENIFVIFGDELGIRRDEHEVVVPFSGE